tara:strand:+ start:4644 stop:5225 length:582 start_codon:yes stop_codon:yes gene_type:complete
MYNILDDIAAFKAMLNDFVPFVQSPTIFWKLSNPGPFMKRYPTLTIAGIIFCMEKLTKVQTDLDSNTTNQKNNLVAQMNYNLSKWNDLLIRKSLFEINSRLRSWKIYVDDCINDINDYDKYYTEEIYGRVYIHLLLQTLKNHDQISILQNKVHVYDRQLAQLFVENTFLWDESLQIVFPRKNYWYLYGRLKTT